MSSSPSELLSKLSLENILSTSRMQSRAQMLAAQVGSRKPNPADDTESEADVGEEEEVDDDEEREETKLTSASGFHYDISRLSDEGRGMVEDLFDPDTARDSPSIFLQECSVLPASSTNRHYYVFHLQEVTSHIVRIKRYNDTDQAVFSCRHCNVTDVEEGRAEGDGPELCKHIIWLLDRIAKHTLYDNDPGGELHFTESGSIAELDQVFGRIADVRLDILADEFPCHTRSLAQKPMPPTPSRIRKAREMVASIMDQDPRKLMTLDASYEEETLVHRGDIVRTVFSWLVSDARLFDWIRAHLDSTEPPADPFHALEQRVNRVIQELDDHAISLENPAARSIRVNAAKEEEGPCDVHWAARQIEHIMTKLHALVARPETPLTWDEAESATVSLVRILSAVVSHNFDSHPGFRPEDRNLYQRLIGTHDRGFAINTLELLVEHRDWGTALGGGGSGLLETIESVGYGCPASWSVRMRDLVRRMNSYRSWTDEEPRRSSRHRSPYYPAEYTAGEGSSGSQAVGWPRIESSPAVGVGLGIVTPVTSAPSSTAPSSSSTAAPSEFLKPELPPQLSSQTQLPSQLLGRGGYSGRGGHGGGGSSSSSSRGAGSKRSGPSTSERGSKRAR